jgi:hypothetical protein
MEDRSHRSRYTTPTLFAPESPITHPPALGGPAPRANETVWPAQPFKIVEAGVIIGKPGAKLSVVTRVIPTGLEDRGRWQMDHALHLGLTALRWIPPFLNLGALF